VIPAAIFEKRLLVVTGKGGVGKTTVAAALGTAAAARGLRTIVAEVASRGDAARSLGVRAGGVAPVVFAETEVAPGLHHISIDPELAMEEYLVDQLPMKALAGTLASSRLFAYLAAATPGLRELLTVGKVWELAQPVRRTPGARPYDLVILDAPATGHGLALLQAPRTFAQTARVGPVARQGRTIDEMLSDPRRTGVLAVTTAEETPVSEALVLRAALREQAGLEVDAVVVNALLSDRLSAAQATVVAAALVAPAPVPAGQGGGAAVTHRRAALRAAGVRHSRARAQRTQLQRLRRGLGPDVPVLTLPALPAQTLGDAEITVLSRRLSVR
jgi:anion-transporting  ArsA/GET3 family ATPase